MRISTISFAILIFALGTLSFSQPETLFSVKKGIGIDKRAGITRKKLRELNVSWYYNWDPQTDIQSNVQFIPMIWSSKHIPAEIQGDYVLGFNEPDLLSQANMSVKEALAEWPNVVAKAKYVGSPSMAHNPVYSPWFVSFMNGNPKVDFITVHWYKEVNANLFIDEIKYIHKKYDKPLWITEYSCQTNASSRTNPDQYTQDEVNLFINQTVHWMEVTPWIIRYAWHDSGVGTSALFDASGQLTQTGAAYASAQ